MLTESTGSWIDADCNLVGPAQIDQYQYMCEAELVPQPLALTTDEPATCPPVPSQPTPLTVTCSKGRLTVPPIDLDNDEIEAKTAQFIGDQSNKCRNLAYQLPQWAAQRLGSDKWTGHRLENGSVTMTCKGKGVLEVSDSDAESAETVNLIVNIVGTFKCREFFREALIQLLGVR